MLLGRAGWNLADQGLSSITNALLSLVVARALSADGFGAFAVAFTVYTFLVVGARSIIFQPLVARFTHVSEEEFRTAARSATGASLLLGVAVGAVTLGVGVLINGPVGPPLAWMGILLPGLLLQDMWRMVFIADGKPKAATINDLLWAVVQFSAVGMFLRTGHATASVMLIGWGGAALVSAIFGVYQFKQWPRPFAAIPWMISQRDLVGYYIASFLSVIGANQLTLLLIAILGSAADVGALRAADVIMGPLNVAGYSLSAFAVPEFSRRQLAGRTAIRVSMMLSALLVSVDLVWGAVLLAMPDHVGEVLLGDTWANAQAVLPWSLAALVGIGISFGASTLMIARGFARDAFWTNALLAPSFLIFGIGGLLLWGAPGAAAGFALAQWVVAPVAWWRVLGLIRREDTGTGEGEAVHVAVSPS